MFRRHSRISPTASYPQLLELDDSSVCDMLYYQTPLWKLITPLSFGDASWTLITPRQQIWQILALVRYFWRREKIGHKLLSHLHTLYDLVIIHMAINYSQQCRNITTNSTACIPSCMNSVLDSVIWNSPFSMVRRLQAVWAGFISQQRVKFFFSLLPGPVLGPTHLT